jgi:hypothetical protein
LPSWLPLQKIPIKWGLQPVGSDFSASLIPGTDANSSTPFDHILISMIINGKPIQGFVRQYFPQPVPSLSEKRMAPFENDPEQHHWPVHD